MSLKNHLLKPLMVFAILVTFTNCETEPIENSIDTVTMEEQNTSSFGTVPIKQSIAFFKSRDNNPYIREEDNLALEVDLSSIRQAEITNTSAKINLIDATTKFDNVESTVMQIEIDGTLQTVVYNTLPRNTANTSSFTGNVVITNLSGGVLNNFEYNSGALLGEINLNSYNINPDPCWGITCGFQLEEIVLNAQANNEAYIHYANTSNVIMNYQFVRSNNNYGSMGIAYASYYTQKAINEYKDGIDDKLTNPCARGVFEQLLDGIYTSHPLKPEIDIVTEGFELNFSQTILRLFDGANISNISSFVFDYSISNGNLSSGANASTNGLSTTINNSYLNTATELSIARTMIHELVHAYLNVRYGNPLSFNNGIDFRLKMEAFARDNGISNISSNEFHHEFMGQYINGMAYSLYEWDKTNGTGGNLGWNYYYAMAFSGQFQVDVNGNVVNESDTFKALVPDSNKRKEIIDKIINEQKGNSDAKGTKCD